ncbi:MULTISPECIES: heme o synthase [Staphylococcus]|uniref:Protoheme IX farnesyltransferase n=1 Tax=Staphylococcus ureilyticus TaxID=94138 RepID=A0AB34AGI6_STAUR|nr:MULTISPECIES: heme o synthase [Staphylococcus]AVL78541.1 protoheme IX farnesyltransferase [Staphylococcus cohnii]MBL0377572.1 protoheme IX farnesyltransferase [Staphylococcus sp. S75]MBL0382704.1 protoheme IX farnesyltransferase [Staphylococcus sp. S59]MBL0401705.1 protoheme IX farnesyltransferase [Staphylococcus sp. S36]MCT1913798.1 heme o synthase [Staphylococcus ureilyticus]
MNKEQTLSHNSSRVTFKELQQIIKMGLVQGNLIPAFAGSWLAIVLANHSFLSSIPQILMMLVGSTLIMGGACALNNYYDQDIDSIMPSKQQRPSVNGKISNRNLLLLSFGMMLVGEALLFALNIPSGVIGLLGIVGYVSFYSIWSKRHTVWNTVIGSFPGAVPPLIGWTAIESNISIIAVALFLVIFCWQPVHFYALAIKRKDEYSLANIPMLPSVKGFKRTRVSMFIWLILLLPLPLLLSDLGTTFMVLATLLNLGWLYLGLTSFKKDSDQTKWATKMFVYSLNYLVVFFVLVVVVSLIKMF